MIEWTGVNEARAVFDQLQAKLKIANAQFLREASTLVISEAQKNFVGDHPRGTPRPAGGNRPMNVTGALRRSIIMERMSGLSGADGVRVGPTMVYARSVELKYGYKYFGPAVTSARPQIANLAKSIFARAFS